MDSRNNLRGPRGLRRDWRDHAACSGMDTAMFFHQVGASVHVRQAIKVCNGDGDRPPCPVRRECGEFALSFPKEEDIAGVFGGMTPSERNRIRKQRRHGTDDKDARPTTTKEKTGPTIVKAPADPETYSRQLALLLRLVHDVMLYDSQGKRRRVSPSRPNPATG